jgi:copper oxidase (laccase) domain-containing protein
LRSSLISGVFLIIWDELISKGKRIKGHGFDIFFGNDRFHPNDIRSMGLQTHLLHQVHGDRVIHRHSSSQKADGHWTDEKNQPLFIKTADCLPVFLCTPRKVVALHIGWRGLACSIFDKALMLFESHEPIDVYVGPHIMMDSFQVDLVTASKILSPTKLSLPKALKLGLARPSYRQHHHIYLDLQGLLLERYGHEKNLRFHPNSINTVTSPHHFSHRRNRWRKGINYSFVMKS